MTHQHSFCITTAAGPACLLISCSPLSSLVIKTPEILGEVTRFSSVLGWWDPSKVGTHSPISFLVKRNHHRSLPVQGCVSHNNPTIEPWETRGKSHLPRSSATKKLIGHLSDLPSSNGQISPFIRGLYFHYRRWVHGIEDVFKIFLSTTWWHPQLKSAESHPHYMQCGQEAASCSWVLWLSEWLWGQPKVFLHVLTF